MGLEDARVVYEHVDPAHLACDALDEAPRRPRVCLVGPESRVGPPVQRTERLLRGVVVSAVVDGDPRAPAREPARDPAPDPARRPCHQSHLPGELQFSPPRLSAIGNHAPKAAAPYYTGGNRGPARAAREGGPY